MSAFWWVDACWWGVQPEKGCFCSKRKKVNGVSELHGIPTENCPGLWTAFGEAIQSFCNGSISHLGASSLEVWEALEGITTEEHHVLFQIGYASILSVLHTLSHSFFFLNRLANLSLRHPDPQPQMIHGDLKIGLWFCSVLFPLAFFGGSYHICNSAVPAWAGTYIGCSSGWWVLRETQPQLQLQTMTGKHANHAIWNSAMKKGAPLRVVFIDGGVDKIELLYIYLI